MRRQFRMLRQRVLRCRAGLAKVQYSAPSTGSIVVIAPHPDDETFGTGGLIALFDGVVPLHVVLLTSGGGSHRSCCRLAESEVAQYREATFRRSVGTLGLAADCLRVLHWTDGAIPRRGSPDFDRAVAELANMLGSLTSSHIFAPHPCEGWSDHVAAEELTRAAVGRSGVAAELYHYCVWFWFSMPLRRSVQVRWRDALTLDISPVFDRKQQAIRAYLDDLAPCGHPWCGRLPREFLEAFQWRRELFFRANSP